jgi:methionyl-tRNA formyltransferase
VRTVYLGTSDFAATVLATLAESAHRPVLVVTRPDRPRGRGRRVAAPPVAEAAAALGIPVFQPDSVNHEAARSAIAEAEPEALCVCAFGALIKEPLLSDYRILNVHPSLLPRWRGAAPIERSIMAGDEVTGVSIMELTAGLDSGPVCAQVEEPISAQDTYGTLAARLAASGGALLVTTFDSMPPCAAQDESGVTYAEKISPADRRLDPTRPATELERTVRALTPHIGAMVELPDGTSLGVREARVVAGGEAEPGTIVLDHAVPVLATAEGALELMVVVPPGRRAMSGEDYIRGLRGAGRGGAV